MKINDLAKQLLSGVEKYHFFIELDNITIDKTYMWYKDKQNFATFCYNIFNDLTNLVQSNGWQDRNGVMTEPALSFKPEKLNISSIIFKIVYRKINSQDVYFKNIFITDVGRYFISKEQFYYKHNK